MKLQTSLLNITPYYMFMQQVSDNIQSLRVQQSGEELIPLQFAGFQGQVNTLNDETVLEVTDFSGSDDTTLKIAPTLRNSGES